MLDEKEEETAWQQRSRRSRNPRRRRRRKRSEKEERKRCREERERKKRNFSAAFPSLSYSESLCVFSLEPPFILLLLFFFFVDIRDRMISLDYCKGKNEQPRRILESSLHQCSHSVSGGYPGVYVHLDGRHSPRAPL